MKAHAGRTNESGRRARAAVGNDLPRRKARFGTITRLAAFHALVIASVLGIVAFQFTQAFSARYRTTIMNDLTQNVSSFTRAAAHRPPGETLAVFTRAFLATQGSNAMNFTMIALPKSHLILGTQGSSALMTSSTIAAALEHPPVSPVFSTTTLKNTSEIVLTVPIVEHGHVVGTFLTTGSLADLESTRRHLLGLALAEGTILLLAAFVSVYLLLARLLGSVRRLTQTAADIGLRGELGVRLADEHAGDEVGAMAATFNAMIAKIDSAVALQRRMMADVSHQLRSPITVVRGHLDVLSRGSLDDPAQTRATILTAIDELDRMNRLVERLLLLGRSLEADFADVVPIDVRALILDLSSACEMLAPRRWAVGPIPDVVIFADLDKLRGAILNLVENAVHATHPEDTIELSARVLDGAPAPTLEIMVDDSGPGIAREDRDAVLTRFASSAAGSSTAGGTGLGLAIVAAIARGHGGSVRIDDSHLGGCRVTIVLPLPAPETSYVPELAGP
ncbi:MAG TPA: HAMP domain-containing sensor histidine kinase [Acidimicrobiales bacterium]|nr:HAMP domain-containing sensor histidine kinase [Acidimicrobiales bacterium]